MLMIKNARPKQKKLGTTGLAKTTNAPPAIEPVPGGVPGEYRIRSAATASSIEPVVVTIPDGCRIAAASRSEIYRLLATKKIQAIKRGARTLILLESLRQHLASLPPAEFRELPDGG